MRAYATGVVFLVALGRDGAPAQAPVRSEATVVEASALVVTELTKMPTPRRVSSDQLGEATYYRAGPIGACGIPTPDDKMVVAVNGAQYRGSCGKCVAIDGPEGRVIAKVTDKCPGCGDHDLDLSTPAFVRIGEKTDGRLHIKWRFVACP